MAGHSKFKNIMHRKGAQDKKRAGLFSKLSREITVAAKMGLPDPDANARLRAAVLAALVAGFGTSTWLYLKEREAHSRAVAAEQQQARLRHEAELRQRIVGRKVELRYVPGHAGVELNERADVLARQAITRRASDRRVASRAKAAPSASEG